ncbi:hypothetical protein FOZ62_000176, partial [Perkinsus olseni]
SDTARGRKRSSKQPDKSTSHAEGCCVTSSHVGKEPAEPAKQLSGHEMTAHPSLKRHVVELHSSGLDLRRRKLDAQGFRDGTGVLAALPSTTAAAKCCPAGDTLANIFLSESREVERSGALSRLCGSATEADVTAVSEVVGRAAERLVPRLCAALGCSPRTAACGSPVRAELGWALCQALEVPDAVVFREIDEGLSLGVESPLKSSGVFPEAKSKAQVNREMEVFHLKKAHRNFLSVEADPETCLTLLRQEVRLGRKTEMSLDEAQKNPNRLYARMALLRKGDGSHRLIEDHTASSLNGSCQLTETCSLPRACDISAGLWDLFESDGRSGEAAAACGCHGPAPQPDEEDDFLLFKYDITGAYKHLFLAESERPRTSVRLGQVVFESKALPFGAAVSPYHWCRGSAGVVRLIGALLRWILTHEKFLSLLYIDDGPLAVRRKVYWLACSLAVLVRKC